MTPKELQSTEILDDFFKTQKKKLKSWKYFKTKALAQISKGITKLQNSKPKSSLSPYLQWLKKELAKLHLSQTSDKGAKALGNEIKRKIKVVRMYIEKEPTIHRKDYAFDVFFLSLERMFTNLKPKKRLEIMADIYLIVRFQRDSYKNWKKTFPNGYMDAVETVRKRIYRAKNTADFLMKDSPYRERRAKLLQSLKAHGKTPKRLTKSSKIDHQIKILENARRQQVKSSIYIDALLLSEVIKKSRLTRPTELQASIAEDFFSQVYS